MNEPDTGYTLEATSGTLTPATSSAFGITADTASKPSSPPSPLELQSGGDVEIAVSVENAKGNVVSSSAPPVTPSLCRVERLEPLSAAPLTRSPRPMEWRASVAPLTNQAPATS